MSSPFGLSSRNCPKRCLCALLKLKPNGWNVIHDYLKLWRWPNHLPKHLDVLFSTKSAKKIEQNKKFQCQASEALGLLPVLVHLVKTFLLPNDLVCPQICKAFLACADIVDLVHLGQTWGVCTPGALQQAAEMCLASWVGSQPSRPYDKEIPLDFAFGACIGKIQKITCLFCNGTQTSLYLQICIKYLQYCCV